MFVFVFVIDGVKLDVGVIELVGLGDKNGVNVGVGVVTGDRVLKFTILNNLPHALLLGHTIDKVKESNGCVEVTNTKIPPPSAIVGGTLHSVEPPIWFDDITTPQQPLQSVTDVVPLFALNVSTSVCCKLPNLKAILVKRVDALSV